MISSYIKIKKNLLKVSTSKISQWIIRIKTTWNVIDKDIDSYLLVYKNFDTATILQDMILFFEIDRYRRDHFLYDVNIEIKCVRLNSTCSTEFRIKSLILYI